MTKDFDVRNENKSRSVCAAMAEAADTGKRVLSEKERRILDMWPRFEDGEPVMVGDESTNNKNQRFTVKRIEFRHGKWMLNDSVTEGHYLNGKSGERVKRTAPKVLDADGVEIKVGDRIYSIETGYSYTVRSINGSGTIEFKDFNDKGWSPKYFTHMQPAFDADGVRIREGDTVWIIPALTDTPDEPHEVIGINSWGEVLLEFHTEGSTGLKGEYLTHARPDSWERLEEAAREFARDNQLPHDVDQMERDAVDLIRRAKKLAGVE